MPLKNKCALLIPVYNEEKTIQTILKKVEGLSFVDEIIIVDDGSRDKTADLVKSWSSPSKKIQLIQHEKNKGKGAAIRTGIQMAQSRFLAIQDADSEYDPQDIKDVFQLLDENRSEVAFGSRFLSQNKNLYRTYLWGNKILTAVVNLLGRGNLTDSYTCYKGMAVSYWRALNLESNGFEIEAEISIKCLMAKWSIKEVPIQYFPRSFQEGKKIRPTDALLGLSKMFQCWLFKKIPERPSELQRDR